VQVAPRVCQLQSAPLRVTLCQPAPERVEGDEIRECLLPVDLDDGYQLPVTRLQLGIAVDRDLFEVEAELRPQLDDGRPGPLAEVAVLGAVETDYG
jgi:hypothetical protein